MAYTRKDLLSALEKVGSIEFTEAEAEAMADLFAQDDEVRGFSDSRYYYLIEVEIEAMAGHFRLGFTATDDLWK